MTPKEHQREQNARMLATFKNADEFIKGGEGSKGGKVIGHTKSGKPVYAGAKADHVKYIHFTREDHKDASKIHGRYGVNEAHPQDTPKHNQLSKEHFEAEGVDLDSLDTKSKEHYEKHHDKIESALENYSEENLSTTEAAQEAGYSKRAAEDADGTAHGDYAAAKAGTYAKYKKHHDEIHDAIGHDYYKKK